MKGYLLLLIAILPFLKADAQSLPYTKLYDDSKLSSIYIYLPADSLEEIYANLENEVYYHADFVFDDGLSTDTVQDIGFRLRGNTSLFSGKKSFKVSFNAFEAGGKYEGVEKLNLLGMHNDPTMVREKLYFELYNNLGLPGRRSNFVRVYINDNYYGLYTNMEHVDEEYIQSRYGENTGNLFKCTWPADLEWRGDNPFEYIDNGYELHINDDPNDIAELINFIDVLNNTPDEELICALEEVFDVQQFLLTYALDVSSGHWDSYGGNINNFYLYHNQLTGKIEFLSFDADNSFGVDWFGIDWTERDAFDWPTGWYDVPLVNRLLEQPVYRDQFQYYIKLINDNHLVTETLSELLFGWRDLIADAAAEDEYRTYDYGFTYDDFWNGFTTNNIEDHTPYGIIPFIDGRHNSNAEQAPPINIPPVLSEFNYWPLYPNAGGTMNFQISLWDDTNISTVQLVVNWNNDETIYTAMYDDGMHLDEAPGDGIYGIEIEVPATTESLEFSIQAEDDSGLSSTFPFCGPAYFNFSFDAPAIVINEVMPLNTNSHFDEAGDADDYIELYNAGGSTVSLFGYYLSDDPNQPWKWQLPNVAFAPDTYLIVWADDEPAEGPYHTNFRLNADGETVGLYAPGENLFAIVDQEIYPVMAADQSWGRLPNGSGPFTNLPEPSPGYNNESEEGSEPPVEPDRPYLTNNPSRTHSDLLFEANGTTRYEVQLFDLQGKFMGNAFAGVPDEGVVRLRIDTERLTAGMYIVRLASSSAAQSFPLIRQ